MLADSTNCLVGVCGVSALERLLRTLQRVGFARATVVTTNQPVIAAARRRSWASAHVQVETRPDLPEENGARLTIPGDVYCDLRLLQALCQTSTSAEIPNGPRLIRPDYPTVQIIDPSAVDGYISSMRRHIPAVCCRVTADNAREVEQIILDSAQKGSLDIPAYVHAPIEKALTSMLTHTGVTPNQITLVTALISVTVTVQFLAGWLVSGTIMALIVGVLDGVDGKLARVKMETTELGKWEHKIDAVLEASWWLALGWYFDASDQIDGAVLWPILLLAAHAVGDLARRYVENMTGRSMDDLSPADRAFRLIGGRRNVYVWMFAIALLLGKPGTGFVAFCAWGMITCAVHVVRGLAVWFNHRAVRA